MHPHTPCPDSERLQCLLTGDLAVREEADLTRHLDECGCCQEVLERAATAGTALMESIRGLHQDPPVPASALWPAQDSSGNDVTQVAPIQSIRPQQRDTALDFLSPARSPEYQGTLGHFDVLRVVGRGGMGLVLHGFDSCLQRDVALKVLDPKLAQDELARKRFCREARAAASVTHENVVAVHQVEREEGSDLPFLVMQLVSGESLEARLQHQGRMSIRDIIHIGMQTAAGLAAAHEKGLIHRDVKPANILLEEGTSRVKLTDFGLARAAEDVRLTHSGLVAGTPLYMAPEQARGEEVDARADLFSLGVVLYEMCTGTPPFDGKTPLAVLKRLTEERHRPVNDLNPDIPAWLADLIDRLLEKDAARRHQTAREVADLLEQHWAYLKSSTEIPQATCTRAHKRFWWISVGVAALGGLLVAGTGFFLLGPWMRSTAVLTPPEDPGVFATSSGVLKGNSGAVWSVNYSPDGSTLAMAVEDGTVKLWDPVKQSVRTTIQAHKGVVWVAVFSRDGKQLATAGDDGQVKVWDLSNNGVLRAFTHPNAVRGLAYSPDGKRLAAGDRQGGLQVWDVEGGNPVADAQAGGAVYGVAYSPDGNTLATVGSDKVVRLWNADNLRERVAMPGHAGPIYGVAFSPDGQVVASVGWDQTVRLWEVASGNLLTKLEGHSQDAWAVAFAPDGRTLVSAGQDGRACVWDRAGNKALVTLRGHTNTVHCVTWSPDGRTIATGGRDGTVRLWDITGFLPKQR